MEQGAWLLKGQGAKERWFGEHEKLIWGAVIKKTWEAGSRAQDFVGGREQGPPMQSLFYDCLTQIVRVARQRTPLKLVGFSHFTEQSKLTDGGGYMKLPYYICLSVLGT